MPRLTTRLVYSVGIFIVISLVALGAVIGVIYVVSARGEQARRDEAKEIARQTESTSSEAEEAPESPANPATTEEEDETPQDRGVKTGGDKNVDELPATGVRSGLYEILVIMLLSLSTAVYVGSRRQQLS